MRALVVAGLLLAARDADAACRATTDVAFRTRIAEAESALFREDAALLGSIVEDVRESVPCFVFSPTPRSWAQYLVLWSVSEFAARGDWQTPLGEALRLAPTVDLLVGSQHPIATFVPAPSPADPGSPVPDGIAVFVDGVRSGTLPTVGLHLVQRTNDRGWWASEISVDGSLSEDFLGQRVRPARDTTWWFAGSVVGGYGVADQLVWDDEGTDLTSDWWRDDVRLKQAPFGATIRTGAVFPTSLGIAVDARFAQTRGSPGTLAQIAALYRRRSFILGAGGGVTEIAAFVGTRPRLLGAPVPDVQSFVVPFALLTGRWRVGDRWTGDVGADLGVGPASSRFELAAGLTVPSEGWRWRFGATYVGTNADFEQQGSTLQGNVGTRRILAEIGLVLGERR